MQISIAAHRRPAASSVIRSMVRVVASPPPDALRADVSVNPPFVDPDATRSKSAGEVTQVPRITAKRVDVCRFAAEVVTVFDTAHGSVVREASVSRSDMDRAGHLAADALQNLHELPVDGEEGSLCATGCAVAAHFGGGKVSTDPTGLDQQHGIRMNSIRHTIWGLGYGDDMSVTKRTTARSATQEPPSRNREIGQSISLYRCAASSEAVGSAWVDLSAVYEVQESLVVLPIHDTACTGAMLSRHGGQGLRSFQIPSEDKSLES